MNKQSEYRFYVLMTIFQALSSLILIGIFVWFKLSNKLPNFEAGVGISFFTWLIFISLSGIWVMVLALFKQKFLEIAAVKDSVFLILAIMLFSTGSISVVFGVVYLVLGGSIMNARLLFFAGIAIYYLAFIKADRWAELTETKV